MTIQMKKVKFNVELTAPNNTLTFKLKRPNINYPDIIGGDFYFELSEKEKELFELIDFIDLLKNAKSKRIFDFKIDF
jgi:hypothetical protein